MILSLITLITGCIDPYYPDINDDRSSLVVEAVITDRPGEQAIYLSHSSPLNDTAFIPETDAYVTVSNDLGSVKEFVESEPGVYTTQMSAEDLVVGASYWLNIVSSAGALYESDAEQLPLPGPPIDSIYWEFETTGTTDRHEPLNGVRFYLDMLGDEDQPRNFRWELEETWIYYAVWYIDYIFTGVLQQWPDPYSLHACWSTETVHYIYTASTSAAVSNSIHRFPLQFVSEETHRLQWRYSLLAKQYTLSDNAYNYWKQVREQNQGSGGIYEKQPDFINGNIYNTSDPDEKVLGFFNLSSLSEKRIFVSGVRELVYPATKCIIDTIWSPRDKPIWMDIPFFLVSFDPMRQGGPPYGVGINLCFDCRNGGGTTDKPDFWK
jgi:hypothetical protein